MEVPTLRDLSMQKVINENMDNSCPPRTLIEEMNEYKKNIQRKVYLEQSLVSKLIRCYPEVKFYKNIKMLIKVFAETVWDDNYYNAKIGFFLAKHDNVYCSKLFGDDYIDKIANMLLDYKITRDNGIEMLYYFDKYYNILNVWDENIYDWKEVINPDNRYDDVRDYKYKLESVIIHYLSKRMSPVF